MSERFEIFASFTEFRNVYTELNNPEVCRDQSRVPQSDLKSGKKGAMAHNKHLYTALEYGLPPSAGGMPSWFRPSIVHMVTDAFTYDDFLQHDNSTR